MVFSSLEFLFFFLPLTLLLYYAVPARFLAARNVVLFAVSLLFYGWGEPVYVFLMLFTITVDYAAGRGIGRCLTRDDRRGAKRWLIAAVMINLGLLGFFKYYDFIVGNLARIPFLSGLRPLGLGLPIGISFYTFQAMSYVIDVWRGNAAPQKNYITFGTYVTLFPQLIAGPIVWYRDVARMLEERQTAVSDFAAGIRRFTVGLCKKVLLGNAAGAVFQTVLAQTADQRSAVGAWLGLLCYTFQIYFDFSGYSDMAIGAGRMFGFTFLENFNYPYLARSITDFWRRWHISLSSWFREYVYIPLGGSRHGDAVTIRNLLVVWFLTGLWHGAGWNFILWGLYYFVLLVIEKKVTRPLMERLPAFCSHAVTLLLVMFGWLIFAVEDLSTFGGYFAALFGAKAGFVTSFDADLLLRSLLLCVLLAIGATPLPRRLYERLSERRPAVLGALTVVLCAVGLVISTAYLVNSSYNPFLYFRF